MLIKLITLADENVPVDKSNEKNTPVYRYTRMTVISSIHVNDGMTVISSIIELMTGISPRKELKECPRSVDEGCSGLWMRKDDHRYSTWTGREQGHRS